MTLNRVGYMYLGSRNDGSTSEFVTSCDSRLRRHLVVYPS